MRSTENTIRVAPRGRRPSYVAGCAYLHELQRERREERSALLYLAVILSLANLRLNCHQNP